jgi:hypothetical protein
MNYDCTIIGYAIGDVDRDESYVFCHDMDDLSEYCGMIDETPEEFAARLGYKPEDFIGVWFLEVERRVYFMLSEGIDKKSIRTIDDFVLTG